MSLYSDLQKVKSEEDVKDAYIKALGLKTYSKSLVDLQTREVWFEAKNSGKNSFYAMFTQLLHYVQVSLNKGEPIPPLLAVIDSEKAAIMRTSDVIPFLAKKTIKWGKSASQYSQEALEAVSAHIGTYLVGFKLATDETEFLAAVKSAIATGDIIRAQITPDNLKQVFDKWVALVGKEIRGASAADYDLLFYADIMHDGKSSLGLDLPVALLQQGLSPVFKLHDKIHELESDAGYRQFWAIYHRPPKPEYRKELLERRDSLIPIDERSFKGAFYTPLAVVDRAYDLLADTLGKNWQKEYYVWDMCCGVGNLEVKHNYPRRLYMSTLDQSDIDVMKATKTCAGAFRFQYDYLNDDIAEDGSIDYSLTSKVPSELRAAIAEGKKILVLINPPYAEAMNAGSGVANTRMSSAMGDVGFASRELFTQFVMRIYKEIPNAVVGMFSKLKYVNSPNFERFRSVWRAKYLGGFVIHSQAFDGLKGDFPIGFLVWNTDQRSCGSEPLKEISTLVLNKRTEPIGEKWFYNIASDKLINGWIDRTPPNKTPALPLKNAINPATGTKDVRGSWWADGAIGGMICKGSDLQNAGDGTALLSSGYCSAGGILVTQSNLWKVAIAFACRRVVKKTWLNDRDQFLIPTVLLPEEFKSDCLVWMLFNGSNLTAGADGLEWNGKTWSLINHFIPFTEQEVGAPGRFESGFMAEYIADLTLSPEALAVMDAGRAIWHQYFAVKDTHKVRTDLKLNRSDVGWYQIRNAIGARNASGDAAPVSFDAFEAAYKALGDKIRPQVYELGFLMTDVPRPTAPVEIAEVLLAEAAD